jgi:hypothetical protein
VPNQVSSQNLILVPSPTIYLKPNLIELIAHIKPLKNLEAAKELQFKMFGSLVLYLGSMKFFHNFLSPAVYLLSQETSRQMFTSLRQGIPNPLVL